MSQISRLLQLLLLLLHIIFGKGYIVIKFYKTKCYSQFLTKITTISLFHKTTLLLELRYILISYFPKWPLNQSLLSCLFCFFFFLYWRTFYCCSVLNVRDEGCYQVRNVLHTDTLSLLPAVIWEACASQWILRVLLNFHKKIVKLDGLWIWQTSSARTVWPWYDD